MFGTHHVFGLLGGFAIPAPTSLVPVSSFPGLPYTDGILTEPTQIRTYEREWRIDLNELHYQFEIRERVSIPKEAVKMQTIEKYQEEVME